MAKKFRRKHVVKALMIALYALMVISMVTAWSFKGN